MRQLVEYKKYKDAAFESFPMPRRARSSVHRRGGNFKPEASGDLPFDKVGLFDLLAVFQKALPYAKLKREDLRDIFEDRFTVSDKIQFIQGRMTERQRIVFEELFVAGASRTEIVVTFLAVLELIRLRQIDVVQESSFAPIERTWPFPGRRSPSRSRCQSRNPIAGNAVIRFPLSKPSAGIFSAITAWTGRGISSGPAPPIALEGQVQRSDHRLQVSGRVLPVRATGRMADRCVRPPCRREKVGRPRTGSTVSPASARTRI